MALLASQLADLSERLDAWLDGSPRYQVCGQVERAVGLLLEASGLSLPVGARCQLELPQGRVAAEVVGFSAQRSFLMALTPPHGVYPGVRVVPAGEPFMKVILPVCDGK